MAAPHLQTLKTELRRQARAIRAACDPALGQHLTAHVLAAAPPPFGAAVGGFWPLPGEIDIRPLLAALHHAGHPVLLPETPPPGQPLIFRHWHPGAALRPGRFNTFHPDGPIETPTWLLVPLLAFDTAGRRLGYGGGYYDRTLAALPGALTIGCAFAAQQIDEVPAGPHDIPLHKIATEIGVIDAT